jgi:hypothetical protein
MPLSRSVADAGRTGVAAPSRMVSRTARISVVRQRFTIVALTLFILGCSGGGDSPTTAGETVTALQLSGVPDTLAVGETATATARAALSGGGSRAVTAGWTANPSWLMALTPSGDGVTIAANGAGTVTITVTDGAKSASKSVVVMFERYQQLTALVSDTLRVGRVVTPPIAGVKSGGVTVGVFDAIVRSSNPGVISVSGRTLSALTPGTADVTFESGGIRIARHLVVESPPVLIDVRIVGTMSPALQQAVQLAAARWQDVFANAWAATSVSLPANACIASQAPITNEMITGVRVYVEVNSAGVAGALARGGSCYSSEGRTVVGRIYVGTELERATPATMQAIIKHELGHVFGLMALPMLADVPGPNPRWIGAEARRQFTRAGGVDSGGVPIETETEVPAGAYGHWRLSRLPDEIMTTFAGRFGDRPDGGPLSAITLGALADLGYPIRMSGADPYRVDKTVPTVMPDRRATHAMPEPRANVVR